MTTDRVLAEHTISMTKFRKKPAEVFKEEQPVAVLSNNKAAGYVVRADVYENMIALLERYAPQDSRQFRPSRGFLQQVKRASAEWLDNATEKELEQAEFEEV